MAEQSLKLIISNYGRIFLLNKMRSKMIGYLEDIENGFEAVFKKVYSYQCWLETSKSHFETDKYIEDLIALQKL